MSFPTAIPESTVQRIFWLAERLEGRLDIPTLILMCGPKCPDPPSQNADQLEWIAGNMDYNNRFDGDSNEHMELGMNWYGHCGGDTAEAAEKLRQSAEARWEGRQDDAIKDGVATLDLNASQAN